MMFPKMMKKLMIFASLLVSFSACDQDRARLQVPEELGADADEYLVPAVGGQASISVYTNMPGGARLLQDVPWARLLNGSFSADAVLTVDLAANTGPRRRVSLLIETAARQDTVYVKQEGEYEEYLTLGSTGVVAYNAAGDTKVPLQTNVEKSKISLSKVYLDKDADDWIQAIGMEGAQLVLSTSDNPSETDVRKAVVVLSYRDGWDESLEASLRVTQANANNVVGTRLTFAQMQEMATAEPTMITDDYTLEGYVISDRDGGNAGENPQSTSTTVDYSGTVRTAYLESTDGSLGVMLEFGKEEDNILRYNSRAQLNLKDASLVRYSHPDRLVLRGMTASNILTDEDVDASLIPVKRKRISQLTDADVYTRVTLIDCEFPIRKGSLTPVNEGYAPYYNSNRISKFPTLLRDVTGSSLYLYTNIGAEWRRTGVRIGYGSGSVTGVLVHEKYRSFIDADAEDEDDCGNIGDYQIRPQALTDIVFADNFHDGFSEMICEWRYVPTGNADGSWDATYGSGTMDHSYHGTTNSVYHTHVWPVYDFSYLGPINPDSESNEHGFGIILEDGTDYAADYTPIDRGRMAANNTYALAWMREYWWDKTLGIPQFWLVHFSTKGITTNVLSMQFSVLNASQEGLSPNQWVAQWSTSAGSAAIWTDIAEYSVPDVVLWNVTQPWQCAGFKPIDVRLPLEMLDKDDVYIRLMPRNRKGSTPQGYLDTEYDNGTAGSSSKANSAMNYFAIRYNK